MYGHLTISSLLVTYELFHLRVVTNTLQLLTGTIYRMTLETVCSSVNILKHKLKSRLFSIAYIA